MKPFALRSNLILDKLSVYHYTVLNLAKDCIWHNIFGTYFLHRLLIKVCCWRIKFATIKTGKNNSPSCLFWRNRSLYIKKHHRPVHHGLAPYILGPDIVNIIGKPILRSAAQLGLGWARKFWVWPTFFEQTIFAELWRANKKNWVWLILSLAQLLILFQIKVWVFQISPEWDSSQYQVLTRTHHYAQLRPQNS